MLTPSARLAAVLALAARLPDVRRECLERVKDFDWRRVAALYRDLYASVAQAAKAA